MNIRVHKVYRLYGTVSLISLALLFGFVSRRSARTYSVAKEIEALPETTCWITSASLACPQSNTSLVQSEDDFACWETTVWHEYIPPGGDDVVAVIKPLSDFPDLLADCHSIETCGNQELECRANPERPSEVYIHWHFPVSDIVDPLLRLHLWAFALAAYTGPPSPTEIDEVYTKLYAGVLASGFPTIAGASYWYAYSLIRETRTLRSKQAALCDVVEAHEDCQRPKLFAIDPGDASGPGIGYGCLYAKVWHTLLRDGQSAYVNINYPETTFRDSLNLRDGACSTPSDCGNQTWVCKVDPHDPSRAFVDWSFPVWDIAAWFSLPAAYALASLYFLTIDFREFFRALCKKVSNVMQRHARGAFLLLVLVLLGTGTCHVIGAMLLLRQSRLMNAVPPEPCSVVAMDEGCCDGPDWLPATVCGRSTRDCIRLNVSSDAGAHYSFSVETASLSLTTLRSIAACYRHDQDRDLCQCRADSSSSNGVAFAWRFPTAEILYRFGLGLLAWVNSYAAWMRLASQQPYSHTDRVSLGYAPIS